MLKATLSAHLHEYRLALGETIKEKEALELLLTHATGLLETASELSKAARTFIVTDARYVELSKWVRGKKG